jgi:predicted alpha/beta superfamily hydrolase
MLKENSIIGNCNSEQVFVQPVDDHDLEEMEFETKTLKELTGSEDWCILPVRIRDWNRELTPWESGPIWGKEGFGDGASETLDHILHEIIPEFDQEHPCPGRKYFIGGYSLAGLSALWAVYQTDRFSGAAAVSPSVWYPGWISYAKEHKALARHIYLSLGDKEEKTRNKVMATVGDAIRKQQKLLADSGKDCVLEWNPGNHFKENGIRMAKGFAWLLKHERG